MSYFSPYSDDVEHSMYFQFEDDDPLGEEYLDDDYLFDEDEELLEEDDEMYYEDDDYFDDDFYSDDLEDY